MACEEERDLEDNALFEIEVDNDASENSNVMQAENFNNLNDNDGGDEEDEENVEKKD